jgi:phosphoribosylanthranilate isomerase
LVTAVKICGITRAEDALTAVHAGAQAIGLVLYDKSPRHVSHARAREIVSALPPFVTAVALMVDPEPDQVRAVIDAVRPQLLQFHGDESPAFCESFSLPYIKAIRVHQGVDLLQCAGLYAGARGLLLDAYVEGNHGGTGESFDWNIIPSQLPLPVVLAGGLNPGNVAQAVRRVRPWAVDVSSGVESKRGVKDAAKIVAFIQGARDADV